MYLFWGPRKEISREEVVRKISNANPVLNLVLFGFLVGSGALTL